MVLNYCRRCGRKLNSDKDYGPVCLKKVIFERSLNKDLLVDFEVEDV